MESRKEKEINIRAMGKGVVMCLRLCCEVLDSLTSFARSNKKASSFIKKSLGKLAKEFKV